MLCQPSRKEHQMITMNRLLFVLMILLPTAAFSQDTAVIRPKEIDDVLVNPGIGFMTFQRFNGDKLNVGKKWTEGYPIEYQEFDGDLKNENYPMTSLAYFRIYWKFIEPAKDEYRWDLIDKALQTATARGQTLLLRIAPYGTGADNDVPDWYRQMVGKEENLPEKKWRTNPEDVRYIEHFGDMIRDMGLLYDGHPALESIDLSIVGAWGEGAGSALLTQQTRELLVDCYLEAIDQSLKWHISSLNAKSSPVPNEWWPQVNRWLNRMGYRFVLRKLTYPSKVKPGGKLRFTSWWENKGVAPCYRPFRLAFRLHSTEGDIVLVTEAEIRSWLPGDNLYDGTVNIPDDAALPH